MFMRRRCVSSTSSVRSSSSTEMETKTSTSTNTQVSQKGEIITVKKIITTTVKETGKEPKITTEETVEEFKGPDAFDRLPEDLRQALKKSDEKIDPSKLNMKAVSKDFAKEMLELQNKYRKAHGAKPLEMKKEITKYCEERVKELVEKDELVHSSGKKYGENLSGTSSNNPEFTIKADEVVDRWYQEGDTYDFTKEPSVSLSAGHFTQMVWKDSEEFGVAAAKSKSNTIYVVAAYYPSGNYMGDFVANVLPKGSAISANSASSSKKSSTQSAKGVQPGNHGNMDDFNKQAVECHNAYRKKHGCPPLKHSPTLQQYAQEWADNLGKSEKLAHRTDDKYGENLFFHYTSDANHVSSAADACDSWYSEIKDFTFGSETPTSKPTGHFSQMIWKATTEVGMGRSKSKSGKQFIVANYNPAGNFVGKYVENVPKKL